MKKLNNDELNHYVYMNNDSSNSNLIIESKKIKINSSIDENSNSYESLNYSVNSNHG